MERKIYVCVVVLIRQFEVSWPMQLGSQNWDLYVAKTQSETSKQSEEIGCNSESATILKLYFWMLLIIFDANI